MANLNVDQARGARLPCEHESEVKSRSRADRVVPEDDASNYWAHCHGL